MKNQKKMDPQYFEVVKNYLPITEKYKTSRKITGDEAIKLLMRNGTDEEKRDVSKIDPKKNYTINQTAEREVNIKRRIRQYEKEGRSTQFIMDWLYSLIKDRKPTIKIKNNKRNGNSFTKPVLSPEQRSSNTPLRSGKV
jgi:hypothetical protein